MPYVNKPRPYKKEYEQYQGTEEQKKNRAMRNAARRKALRKGKVTKGDGNDIAHKKAVSKGGTNGTGTKVEAKSKNRSFDRDSKNKLVSEMSPRERKKRANS
jgi:hypothetical protein